MSEVKLYLGDCLEVMKSIPDKSVDAVITDLPYGTTRMKWDSVIPLDLMWNCIEKILKGNGCFITTASQPFTSEVVKSNLDDFKYELIWNKRISGQFLNANYQPLKIHENILVFSDSPTTFSKDNENSVYNPQKVSKKFRKSATTKSPQYVGWNRSGEYKYVSNGGNKAYPKSIIEISNADRTDVIHPTQKPVALYKYLINTYSNLGDTVLDICMGSGTTGVACVQTGRNFIGIEIDEKYYRIAEKRIKDAQQQMRLPL